MFDELLSTIVFQPNESVPPSLGGTDSLGWKTIVDNNSSNTTEFSYLKLTFRIGLRPKRQF